MYELACPAAERGLHSRAGALHIVKAQPSQGDARRRNNVRRPIQLRAGWQAHARAASCLPLSVPRAAGPFCLGDWPLSCPCLEAGLQSRAGVLRIRWGTAPAEAQHMQPFLRRSHPTPGKPAQFGWLTQQASSVLPSASTHLPGSECDFTARPMCQASDERQPSRGIASHLWHTHPSLLGSLAGWCDSRSSLPWCMLQAEGPFSAAMQCESAWVWKGLHSRQIRLVHASCSLCPAAV